MNKNAGQLRAMSPAIEVLYQKCRNRYSDQVGKCRKEVITPALLLDLDIARTNIKAMAAKFGSLPASLRPHIKAHKSPHLARLEIEAGAVGVTCATAWEAIAMAEAGISDVLIANEVVHPDKIRALMTAACDHRITVAVDDEQNVRMLDEAAQAAGARLEVLLEVDVGMGRCGVRDEQAALHVAKSVARSRNLRFRGLQGYEGHCMGEPDRQVREQKAAAANEKLVAVADYLASRGLSSQVISGGGTATYYITGANPRITEVQAGSYSLMDRRHDRLVPETFGIALTVLATVVSRQGNTVVLDAGRKALATEFGPPPLAEVPGACIRSYAEEHCIVDFPDTPPLSLGDTVELYTETLPTTISLYDAYHVVEAGHVTDIWPITARGPRGGRV
jgi:D-serine deaminase-like pyridoxal phosphate-dependent protein